MISFSFCLFMVLIVFIPAQGKKPDDLHPEIQDMISVVHDECTKKIGVTDDDVDSYVITNTDPKMMCYMNCLMLESGWMTADGKLNYEQMKEHGSHHSIKEIIMPIIDQCLDIPEGTKECEKAYNFNKCFQRAAPDQYFLP